MQAYELELVAYQAELTLTENRIFEREVELARELDSLIDFHKRYSSTVAALYRELDRINSEICLKFAADTPSPPNIPTCLVLDDDGSQVISANTGLIKISVRPRTRTKKSISLVSLFRKAAIKLHPDLANNEQDRQRRCSAMAQINSAYELGDRDSIELILAQWENNPETEVLEGIYKELNCVIRQLALARNRLKQLDRELADVKADQWHVLCRKERELKAKGKDLIQILSTEAKQEIEQAQKVLNSFGGK